MLVESGDGLKHCMELLVMGILNLVHIMVSSKGGWRAPHHEVEEIDLLRAELGMGAMMIGSSSYC